MTGLQWFLLGNSAGIFIGSAVAWHINKRWYRRSFELARVITNDFTKTLRLAANYIPDKDISDMLIAEANKCDELWR